MTHPVKSLDVSWLDTVGKDTLYDGIFDHRLIYTHTYN